MKNQITAADQSFPGRSSSIDSGKILNSILNPNDRKSAASVKRNSGQRRLKRRVFQRFLVSIWHAKHTNIVAFALFTSIAMTFSILIICFTSPKPPGKKCSFVLKSEPRSSISDDSHPHSIAVHDFNNDGRLDIVVANPGTDSIGVFLRSNNDTFADQIMYPTGSNSAPYGVAVGDFNNDQQMDIVVANFGSNNIGIFLGTRNGTFSAQTTISTESSRPLFVAVGHFNNDTALDVVVVNYGTNNIRVLLGHGNGTFATQITYSTGYDSLPMSLVVNDFNNDHQFDIAVTNYGTNNVGIFLGYGNGTFTTQKIFTTGTYTHPISISSGDFNNDTYMDIVVVNFGRNNVAVLLGYGDGNFTVPTKYSTGDNSSPRSVAVGDFDNDNQLDIAVASYDTSSVGIFFGRGKGTFADQITYFTSYGYSPYSIATGDFNNDSRLDIAVINYDKNYVDILLTYRDYSFLPQTTYTTTNINSNPESIAVADFNNDSRLDIVVANYWTENIGIFIGYGNGTFKTQTTYSTGENSGPDSVAVGDFDSDHRLDIAVVNFLSSSITIFLGYGNGTFSIQTPYSTGSNSQPYSVIVDDFNKDGQLDIAVANYWTNNVGIFIGYGNGSFSTQVNYSTGSDSGPYSVASGDLNNDGWADITVVNYRSNNVGIFLNFGNGIFTVQKTYSTGSGSRPYGIVIGDLNGDGRLDIVVSNTLANNIGVFLGYGTGNLSSQMTFSTGNGSFPLSIAIADFNNDSQVDIVVTNYKTDNVGVFIGYGNGSFPSQKVYSTGTNSNPYAVAVGDLNNDGRLDIAVANFGSSNAAVLLGYGDSFTSPDTYSTGDPSSPYSVAVGDFNADGRLDMVAANLLGDSINVFLGYGNGSFSSQTSYSTYRGSGPFDVAIGDFNNDSRLDIVVANWWGFNIGVFLGYGDGTFSNQITYYTGSYSYPRSVAVGDFNSDKQLDIAVANTGSNNFGVFLGYGDGTFSSQVTFSTGSSSSPYDIAVGDFDNDSQLDVIIINFNTENFAIFLGSGDGNFSNRVLYPTGSSSGPCGVTVSDLNDDNQLDIAVALCSCYDVAIFLGYGDGSFYNSGRYKTGTASWPNSIAVGNFNNDTELDMAVANCYTDNVVIFLGYGDGTFLTAATYSTGAHTCPKSIAIADFNRDSLLDMVVAHSYIGVFLGDTFINGMREHTYSTGSSPHPRALSFGDFNNDSEIDIVVANYGSDNIGISFGRMNKTFSVQTRFTIGSLSFPTSIAIGDLDNDSNLDVAIANSGAANVGVLYGYGNGTFMSLATYPTGNGSIPLSIATGDFNNDKRLDIAVASDGTDNVNVFLRYDSGAFAWYIPYSTGNNSNPWGVAIGDFNNDSWLDFVVTNRASDNIGVFLALGNGSFSEQVTYSTGSHSLPWAVAVADFNNDNRLDIVITNCATNNIGVFLGLMNGTFSNQTTYSTGSGSSPVSITIGDLNNDSCWDIVVANPSGYNIGIFLGYGNGTFSSQITYPTGNNSYPQSVAIGDFNNDRQSDIVVANYRTQNVGVFLSYKNGTFSNQLNYSTGSQSSPLSVAVGDFNNDSRLDIVVASYITNTIIILFGYGDGTYSSETTYSTGSDSGPSSVTTGDFNNDNQLDIAFVNTGNNNIGIFLGCTNGTFFSQLTYSTGNYSDPNALAVNDFNGDSRLDIVVTNYGNSNVDVFLGFASETFLSAAAYSTGFSSQPVSIAVGDIDKDSRLDIVVASNSTDSIMVLFGSGFGTFVRETIYFTGGNSYPRWVAVGDLNNDSWLDVVVANSGTNNVGVFLSIGNGTFSSQTTYFTDLRSQPYAVGVGDFDNDTRLDIVVANYGSNNVNIFLGYGNGSFADRLVFNTGFGSRPFALVVGDIYKDKMTDVVITNDITGNIDILAKIC